MGVDKSVFVAEFRDRYNAAILAGNSDPPVPDIENEIIDDPTAIPVRIRRQMSADITNTQKERRLAARSVARSITEKWGKIFNGVERCLAHGDYLKSLMGQVVAVDGREVLSKKDPRKREDRVTGALLKCFLMIGFHAKACVAASEILLLVRNGYPNGAQSRVRSLYEHSVIALLIVNDQDYELSERYQDYAAVEKLKELRAAKPNMGHEVFYYDDGEPPYRALEVEMARLEEHVADAKNRWGKEIVEQYGWAWPAMPEGAKHRKRLTFVDLERAIGTDFLRHDYLWLNNYVHAGPASVISYADSRDSDSVPMSTRPLVGEDRLIVQAISRTLFMLEIISRVAARTVFFETETHDHFFWFCEMKRAVEKVRCELREKTYVTGPTPVKREPN